MKCIDEVPASEFAGKRVLLRAGLDLSLDSQGRVTDLFRVKRALPTLEYLRNAGARTIILSHIGRDTTQTNAPVAAALAPFMKVVYVPDLLSHAAHAAVEAMQPGDIVLLENIRQHYDLEKENDEGFAKELASLGEVYVNDSFSSSHRAHASMVALAKLLPHYAGILVRDEVKELTRALTPPEPSFALVGGAKFETKDPIIRVLLDKYDHVGVVGALANDILKAKGSPVGHSLVSEHAPGADVLMRPTLLSSVDVTVERIDGQVRVVEPYDVSPNDKIVDIGPDTVAQFAEHIRTAQFILWNGPTGLYEAGFLTFTHQIGQLIQRRAEAGASVVIGGGDTIAALEQSHSAMDKLGFLSTGGGAMLEFLVQGTLPALEALK